MEYKDVPKKDLKAYQALERRVTDIFNGATGNGDDADWWEDNELVTVAQVGIIMNAVDKTFETQLKKCLFESFEIIPAHAEYFEQPRKATLWLFEIGVRA